MNGGNGGIPGGTDDIDNTIPGSDGSDDVNCDFLGTCYDGKVS